MLKFDQSLRHSRASFGHRPAIHRNATYAFQLLVELFQRFKLLKQEEVAVKLLLKSPLTPPLSSTYLSLDLFLRSDFSEDESQIVIPGKNAASFRRFGTKLHAQHCSEERDEPR